MRAIAIITLFVASQSVLLPAIAGAEETLRSKQPKKQSLPFTISKETTYLTEPLRKDGSVDYLKALNQQFSKGVAPDNNAAVLYWKAMGPSKLLEDSSWPTRRSGEISPQSKAAFFKALGIAPLPTKGLYFSSLYEHLRQHKPPLIEEQQDKIALVEQDHAMENPWSEREHPHIAAWLRTNEKPLQLIVEGSRRPRCYTPMVGETEGSALITTQMSRYSQYTSVARALSARAMLRVNRGRTDDALNDLVACYRLGAHVGREPSLYEMYKGISIEARANATAVALARSGRLSAKQARRLGAELDKLPSTASLAAKFRAWERYYFLDIVQLIAPDGSNGFTTVLGKSGKPFAEAMRRRDPATEIDWDSILRRGNKWFDQAVAATASPTRAGRVKACVAVNREISAANDRASDALALFKKVLSEDPCHRLKITSEMMGDLLLSIAVPWTQPGVDSADRSGARSAVVRVAIALVAYRAERGSYPAKLKQLVPEYVKKLPADPCAADGLRYRTMEQGYLLYSIGTNGKDNGGKGFPLGLDEAYKGDGATLDDVSIIMPKRRKAPKKAK